MSEAKEIINLLEQEMNEMAINLRKEETGLPMLIWCPMNTGVQHKQPYIKVALDNSNILQDAISVSIEKEPKYLRDIKGHKKGEVIGGSFFGPVKDFILKNYNLLVSHWDGDIFDLEFGNKIEKI